VDRSHSQIQWKYAFATKQIMGKRFPRGERVWLGKTKSSYYGFTFEHWFMTNGTSFLEFGAPNFSIYAAIVNINDMPRQHYEVVPQPEMVMDEGMENRMNQVVGLANYSLCLRNCEHLANYVMHGRWCSSQMDDNGRIMDAFRRYLMSESQIRLVNTPPSDIRTQIFSGNAGVVYDFLMPYYKATGFDYYLDAEEDAYNLLIIGPTGVGKSHLINVIFNSPICESRLSHLSVTPEVFFIRGEGQIISHRFNGKTSTDTVVRQRKVVVTDTIGICDTRFTNEQIFNLIQGRVSRNFKTIHGVIIVITTDRIIPIVQDHVKKVMEWLDYEKNHELFLFVFTKSENTNEAQQQYLRKQAIDTLGLKNANDETLNKVVYVGFPSPDLLNDVGKQRVINSYNLLKRLVVLEPSQPPINLERGWKFCSIL
jgi:GTPase SAR1 family protein